MLIPIRGNTTLLRTAAARTVLHTRSVLLQPLRSSFIGEVALTLVLLDTYIAITGHLHCPNDIDRSLNEVAADKIRKYRADYNNNPHNAISFIPTIASTSGEVF